MSLSLKTAFKLKAYRLLLYVPTPVCQPHVSWEGSLQFCLEPGATLKRPAPLPFDMHDGLGAVALAHSGSRADKITKPDSLYIGVVLPTLVINQVCCFWSLLLYTIFSVIKVYCQ